MPPDQTDDGLRAAIEIRREPAQTRHSDAVPVSRRGLRTGSDRRGRARGRLSAEGPGRRCGSFADAVRRVANGGSALDPEMVALMVGRRRRHDPLEALTPREHQVLALMAEGKWNLGIAEALGVTLAAVEKHVGRIFAKLGLRQRAARAPPRAGGAHAAAGELIAGSTGSAASTRVASPIGDSSLSDPPTAATRSSSPASPDRRNGQPPRRHARRSATVMRSHCASTATRHARFSEALGVLGDVGQRLGDDEIGGALDHR